MRTLTEFLFYQRSRVKSRLPGWRKAQHLLALHEKFQDQLNQPSPMTARSPHQIRCHRQRILQRVRDLRTLKIAVSPARANPGEVELTVTTHRFPEPVAFLKFFTNPLYKPAFRITGNYFYYFTRVLVILLNEIADHADSESVASRIIFYGWDGERAVVQIRQKRSGQSGESNGITCYFLVGREGSEKILIHPVSSQAVHAAIRRNPDPAYPVYAAQAKRLGVEIRDIAPAKCLGGVRERNPADSAVTQKAPGTKLITATSALLFR